MIRILPLLKSSVRSSSRAAVQSPKTPHTKRLQMPGQTLRELLQAILEAQAFVMTRFLVSTLSRGGAWGPASGFGTEICGQSNTTRKKSAL